MQASKTSLFCQSQKRLTCQGSKGIEVHKCYFIRTVAICHCCPNAAVSSSLVLFQLLPFPARLTSTAVMSLESQEVPPITSIGK